MRSYDLAIIGSGPAGYVAGIYASRHNIKTCVIENDLVGGTCLNRGCIPTKVLLHSASLFSELKESSTFGIESNGYKLNFQTLVSRKDEVVKRLRTGIETLFKANKIDLIRGKASLLSANTIDVTASPSPVEAKNIIIASGSRPAVLPGIDVDEYFIRTSDGILNINQLPESILIVGGGVIGCEFASFFSAAGSHVTILELMDRLIPSQSREASRKLETIFKKRGVDIITSDKIGSLTKGPQIKARTSSGKEIEVETVLVSTGRKSNIEGIGLDKVGIETDSGKIRVDESLQTSIKNIYAIGDCVKGPLLAYKASYDAILACDNILGKARRADYSNIPNCIFTLPEIASVGLIEDEAKKTCPGTKVAKFPYIASGKALINGKQDGYIKVIGSPEGKLLGVEIFGEEACDLIGEASLAMHVGASIRDISHVVHGHPTLSEIFQEAAHIFCGTPIHSI